MAEAFAFFAVFSAALSSGRRSGASLPLAVSTLVNSATVAKLDLLSRDVAFIAGLMAQRVPFIVVARACVDVADIDTGRACVDVADIDTAEAERFELPDQRTVAGTRLSKVRMPLPRRCGISGTTAARGVG